MTRPETTWDAVKGHHPATLSDAARRVLEDYYNSLGANIPDPPTTHHTPGPRTLRVIHNTIADHPYSTATTLTDLTGYSRRTIDDALRHLIKHGEVTKHRHRNGRHANTYSVRP